MYFFLLFALLVSPVLAEDLDTCHAFIYTDDPKQAETFIAGLDPKITRSVIPITTTDRSAKRHWEVTSPCVVMTAACGLEVKRIPLITANPVTAKADCVAFVRPTPAPKPPSEEAILLRALAVKTGVSEAEILAAKTTLESEAAAKAAATPTPTPVPAEEPIEAEGK